MQSPEYAFCGDEGFGAGEGYGSFSMAISSELGRWFYKGGERVSFSDFGSEAKRFFDFGSYARASAGISFAHRFFTGHIQPLVTTATTPTPSAKSPAPLSHL